MSAPFTITDPTTWAATLTLEEVAAIYRRTPAAILKACQSHRFTPAPYLTHPRRWRRVDVERHVIGNRAVPRLLGRTG